MTGYKIVFMGTPEFAVPSLRAIHASGHEIVKVVTQPDRPKGRGRILTPPPVKEAALAMGIPVLQPESIDAGEFVTAMQDISPDYFVVIAFGRVLPINLLAIPKYGAINVHGSLLPKYRGAAPIQWALINGETETGVTTMLMDSGLDTGDIFLSRRIAIKPDDTSETVHDRLSLIGADLIVNTLDGLEAGEINPKPQNDAESTYAPALKKDDGRIPWRLPAERIVSFIRGVTPWPGAFTYYKGRRLKIFSARAVHEPVSEKPGVILPRSSDELWVATGEGLLDIMEIQGFKGKRLPVKDFLHGAALEPGTAFE